MGTTAAVGDGFAGVRGVAALAVMLGAARLPDRLAGAGVKVAVRIAPPEPVEDGAFPAGRVPAQRVHAASGAVTTARPLAEWPAP